MAELPPLVNVHEDTIEAWAYIGCVIYVFMDTALMAIVANHAYKIYQDLFTKERKSLDHRRQKPAISQTYKANLYLSLLSITFWECFIISMTFTYLGATTDWTCTILQIFGGSFGVAGKTVMYLLFLVRLHTIYGSSANAPSRKCLTISAAAIITYNTGLCVSFMIIWQSQVFGYADGVHIYPNYCDATLEAITATLYVLGDCVASAGFLYSFIVPLRRTMKALGTSPPSSSQFKAQQKINFIGTKTAILTVVAIISSFNLSLITTVFDLNFVIGMDAVFNSMCIILMTPYYPDPRYYIKLCYLCIWLCAKKQFKYVSGNVKDDKENKNNKYNDGRAQSMKLETTTHKTDIDHDTLSPVQDTQDTNITISPTSYDTDMQLQNTAKELQPPLQNDDNYDQMDDGNEPTAEPSKDNDPP